MTQQEKDNIRERLAQYVSRYPSQNKAVGSLKGTSTGTVSNILNGKYDNISDEMWRNLASQVGGPRTDAGWNIVHTGAYREITFALDDAQQWRNVTWIVGEAGCGKTTTARLYATERREVFYILCAEDMRRGDFVREIARTVGIRTEGCTIRQVWELILDDLVQMDAPLLIFDEADKLTEPVFHYFISLYNRLEDRCGVVFLSTDYIKKRVACGLRYQKPGYKAHGPQVLRAGRHDGERRLRHLHRQRPVRPPLHRRRHPRRRVLRVRPAPGEEGRAPDQTDGR